MLQSISFTNSHGKLLNVVIYLLHDWKKKYIQENQGYTAMPLRRTILGFHVVEVTTTLTLPHLHESANSQMMVPILDLENQQRSSPRKPSCFPTICTYLCLV